MNTRISSLLLTALLSLASTQSFASTIPVKANESPLQIPAPTQGMETQATYYYNFGYWPVGSIAYRDFSFSNYGRSSLRLLSIYTYGTSFNSAHNCPRRLYGGYQCTIRVYFSPWTTGYQDGTLMINTSGEDSRVYLSGYGY